MFKVVANQDTFLKKSLKQASELADTEKQSARKGEDFGIEKILEEKEGHVHADLQAGAGQRWFFKDHWDGWPVKQSSNISYSDKDIDIMARTLYGEARGETEEGKIAVAHCILNRVKYSQLVGGFWWGKGISGVCQNPAQFSCWNKDDPNYLKLISVSTSDKYFKECFEVAQKVLSGQIKDPTENSDHYHVVSMAQYPFWADKSKKTVTIHNHVFYRLYAKAPEIRIVSPSSNKYSEAVQRQIDRLSKYLPQGRKLDLDTPTKYFSQRDNYRDSWRTCNSSSNAMYLNWLREVIGQPELPDDKEYIQKVFSFGDTIYHENQTKALKAYGFNTKWNTDADLPFIKELVIAGFPVVCNILHKGNRNAPSGGHIILLIGRKDSTWIAHDPWGTLSSGYTVFNGQSSQISDIEFNPRWQGGYRILA